jgi:DNA modification methylase
MLTVLQGDCLEMLRELPAESVDCCVTSPPYWGLRDYGHPGQIGLEPTVDEFIAKLVEVFREVRRVLKADGTCWVNMGDSYAGSWGAQGRQGANGVMSDRAVAKIRQKSMISEAQIKAHPLGGARTGSLDKAPGCKPKDLIGQPWMLAFALRTDGWYLRQDIIWAKPNPMPESVRDRCTKAHEYIFLLSKSERYYYDQEAIREPVSLNTHARLSQSVDAQIGSARANGGAKTNGNMKAVARKRRPSGWALSDSGEKIGRYPRIKDNDSFNSAMAVMPDDRNKRSVWTVNTFSFSEAHFATYPPDLIRPCIRAGCPVGGTVLDPFGGSGTTGQVALEEGRSAILIELNPEYIPLIEKRTTVTRGLGI